jgi:hypothetical protein
MGMGSSVGSDKLDKRRLDNRANFSIIDNRPSITIIIELRPWQYYRATTGPMRYIYRPHTTFSLLSATLLPGTQWPVRTAFRLILTNQRAVFPCQKYQFYLPL